MKSTYLIEELPPDKVTPCVGVWIEILSNKNLSVFISVTPCVGVWIEIKHLVANVWRNVCVTPCVGVWIEI